jgi:hypothetical protein
MAAKPTGVHIVNADLSVSALIILYALSTGHSACSLAAPRYGKAKGSLGDATREGTGPMHGTHGRHGSAQGGIYGPDAVSYCSMGS